MCRFRNRKYYTYNCSIKENDYQFCDNDIYNGTLIENRKKLCNGSIDKILENDECLNFVFERNHEKKSYITKNNQNRTGYVLKEKFEYDVICKVEL